MLLWIVYMIVLGLVIWVGYKYDCWKYQSKNSEINDKVVLDKKEFLKYINEYESQEYDSIEGAIKK
jgi:hypothetical protein